MPEPKACNFIKKETLKQVFSCEFCKISKNTFSYKTPPVAASDLLRMGKGFSKTYDSKIKSIISRGQKLF